MAGSGLSLKDTKLSWKSTWQTGTTTDLPVFVLCCSCLGSHAFLPIFLYQLWASLHKSLKFRKYFGSLSCQFLLKTAWLTLFQTLCQELGKEANIFHNHLSFHKILNLEERLSMPNSWHSMQKQILPYKCRGNRMGKNLGKSHPPPWRRWL